MKYERLFETNNQYESALLNLAHPCIVYVVESDTVYYINADGDVETTDKSQIYLNDLSLTADDLSSLSASEQEEVETLLNQILA